MNMMLSSRVQLWCGVCIMFCVLNVSVEMPLVPVLAAMEAQGVAFLPEKVSLEHLRITLVYGSRAVVLMKRSALTAAHYPSDSKVIEAMS